MNEIEIKHGFFTRRGGVSSGELASLNCGFRDYEPRELTLKNRTIVMDTIGLKLENLATAEQIHSVITSYSIHYTKLYENYGAVLY